MKCFIVPHILIPAEPPFCLLSVSWCWPWADAGAGSEHWDTGGGWVIGCIVGLIIIYLLGITSSLLRVMNQHCLDFIHSYSVVFIFSSRNTKSKAFTVTSSTLLVFFNFWTIYSLNFNWSLKLNRKSAKCIIIPWLWLKWWTFKWNTEK